MYKDLEKVGFRTPRPDDSCVNLYSINNANGTPRWIWNSENPKPDFLRFYAITTLRSRLFSIAIRFMFFLKLQHLVFKRKSIKASRDKNHILTTFTQKHFALFAGTMGPNRKLILFVNDHFIKIGLNASSSESVNIECERFQNLSRGVFLDIPECRPISDGIVAYSDLGKNGKRSNIFSKLHVASLAELYSQNPSVSMIFKESEIFQTSVNHLASKERIPNEYIPVNIIEKLRLLSENISQNRFTFHWTHRDFTPWNCYTSCEKIKLYDFELAHPQLPFGYDAFHFVLQQGVLVDHFCWTQLKPLLKAAFEELKEVAGTGQESFDEHLKAYLFINTAFHIDLYNRQDKWHEQIHWLLNTWNDALSDVLQNESDQRALLIGDVFDFLHNVHYAAVKFPNIPPRTLSENTDIDLLVCQKTAKNLHKYLDNHSLVKKVKWQAQSKMMHLLVVLHNDQLLALDLIWQLRVKALEFMDVKLAINEAVKNDFGVKILSQKHTRTYLYYFYGLNDSFIPEKYHSLFEDTPLKKLDFQEVKNQIKNSPSNKGFSALKNIWFYLSDILSAFLFQNGMVITFSGVDGAGKSTIIEHTKKEIEKKFRKKVIVIRHRPSLLPILSAIILGKQKAEQKAENTLPRQGTNKSVLSSLLRFGYYYSDYLFGQLYIYLKHVLRGEIVLYDRYYFDFIHDSLRSNIHLPKWLTKAGYIFIIKPHLNFFLYADSETILNRKQELDAEAITHLTNDYLDLFKELDRKTKGRYFPVENLLIQDTMAFIVSKTQTQII